MSNEKRDIADFLHASTHFSAGDKMMLSGKFGVDDEIRKINERTMIYIEMMAAAYLKETNIPASQVELVRKIDDTTVTWYFRKREENVPG